MEGILAWIIAAFLPLPPNPSFDTIPSEGMPDVAVDIEKALGPIDQARYENARWWRIINRIMSVVGVVAIGAVVSSWFLGFEGTKMGLIAD